MTKSISTIDVQGRQLAVSNLDKVLQKLLKLSVMAAGQPTRSRKKT